MCFNERRKYIISASYDYDYQPCRSARNVNTRYLSRNIQIKQKQSNYMNKLCIIKTHLGGPDVSIDIVYNV